MAFETLTWGAVSLYFPCNGDPISDVMGHSLTIDGAVTASTLHYAPLTGNSTSANIAGLNPTKPGIAVANGAGITDIGLGDYLFAGWVRPSSVASAWQTLLQIGFDFALAVYVKDEGVIVYGGAENPVDARYVNLQADVQQFIEVSRVAGVTRFFLGGALLEQSSAVYSISTESGGLRIGSSELSSGMVGDAYDGYIDDLIFATAGGNTAAYTPPTVPFSTLLDANTGAATGTVTAPLIVNVTALDVARLPLVVSTYQTGTAAAGILVNAISPALASGAATVADSASGAARWAPVVELDGVDITADVVGEITVEASEGAARIASFSLLASGSLDLPSYTGQRVTIDIADSAGSNRIRLFTGLVDVPAVDLVRRLVRITANDDLMNTVNAMDRAAIESLVGGRWSKVVFDDGAVPWSYAQDRLSTVAASLDMDANGGLRLTPWAAKAVADLSFDAGVLLEQSIAVDTAERGALVNDVMVSFGYRFQNAKRDSYDIKFRFMNYGFSDWVTNGNTFLVRSTVERAIESAGLVIDTIDYVELPTSAQRVGPLGTWIWIPNPFVDPLMAMGFDATVTFDYTQSLQEQHAIRVFSQASIDAVGRLPARMSCALEGKTVDTVAAETADVLYRASISKIPGQLAAPTVAGSTTAAVMDLTADTNRAAAEAAMECLIDVAKVKIAASHRSGRVSAALALHPLVDLDKTVAVDADGVQAKGKVVRVLHRMDADSAQALTEFEIAVARLDGSGLAHVDTSTAAPAGVADGVTATLAAPVCTFNGLSGQDQQFTITFPGVDSAERDLRTVDIASEYNVSIIEDDLVVTL